MSSSPSSTFSTTGQCLKGELWQTHLLKTRYPHLKTIMSIGGWTWSDNFSVAFSTAAGRRRVVETSQQLMEQFGFDGLDIDFEFPGMAKSSKDPEANKFWQSSVNDWQNMAAFFTEARAAYGNKYSLSAALPGLPFGANTAWPSLGRTLDYALIMAYENNHMPTRAWGGGTLRSVESDDSVEKIYNVKAGMDDYVAAGIPRNKLILGIPLYGTGFSGLNRNMRFRDNIPGFGVDIRANNLVKLPPTGYNKIMEQVQQGGWTKTVDERRGITVYFNGSHVWFVDTPETIRIKGEYAKQERLAASCTGTPTRTCCPRTQTRS
ncbi:glycoside hydrolase superfamily [Catenaria anguillulae PL171]|uniref:Glycoside hydrolase superfamily n=1 Tax=Catenaria anguillulae PL171 TaxID=765915 RepID=A0A1Y2HKJ7_9FUNG|nr:glycoside hydrolase superfamily [Catenaria anguillulae PL171]